MYTSSRQQAALAEPAPPAPSPYLAAGPRDATSLDLTLQPLHRYLADPELTELCINHPGGVYLETSTGWQYEEIPALDFGWCLRFAKLAANFSRQRVDAVSPLLSASLPGGERIQCVLPPATSADRVAISIRRPSKANWSIEDLAGRGVFADTRRAEYACDPSEALLLRHMERREFDAFMRCAVSSRKNILVSGPTGSGKTTWTRALIEEIPSNERLITIEDSRELVLDRHPNHVRLFYSKDGQGIARVTPKQLLESCLRMRPDRILLAELRGEEAFDYLRNVNSGHPGSITSIHATSAELAFEQLVLLVKQSPAGRELSREDIKQLLYLLVDIVIQFERQQHRRCIKEIWYDPESRRKARAWLGN